MAYDNEELNEIKRQVDRRLWRRGLFGAHAIVWVVGIGIVAIVDAAAVDIVAVAWLGLVLLHGLLVLLWEKRDRDIEAEVVRRAEGRGSEKLKRDRLYRLSDDGELVEVEDDENAPVYDIHR